MTEFLGKLFDRVYTEKDFGINVAIFVAGLAGMSCYLILHDYVLTLFAFIIPFPIVKIIAGGWHQRLLAQKGKAASRQQLAALYDSLTDSEKNVVQHFVAFGGAVMTWGQMNRLDDPQTGVESLVRKGLLGTSVSVDGMHETFELDLTLFAFAYRWRASQNTDSAAEG
ncbi:TPA: hypothetical protein RPB45_001948 [Escherichia coli]|uniref:Uncharacterized protein n=2 Tax=Escherichia coli TaxID=562 RepID=A0A2T1MZM9_ECOLX|nr:MULTISPECIES: hypothetical protein [Enterobacteriaceae]ATE85504.1 hypothetical protein SJJBTUD_0023 [Escherichia phage Ayreon]HDM0072659.1 hypothetical protein [Escherichia coli O8:H9]AWF27850.1 hypothetical protein CSC21_4151 [Escherichia coli]EEY4045803.1 hypothetical protein [Escherichia coli]EFB6819672.1 hypothetical protein [Escherichia coli]